MKFAKELDQQAVPEWRDMYLDYKAGKKKLKAVARAERDASVSGDSKPSTTSPFASLRDGPVYSFLQHGDQQATPEVSRDPGSKRGKAHLVPPEAGSPGAAGDAERTPRAKPIAIGERSPLRGVGCNECTLTRYGSIIGTPPKDYQGASLTRIPTAPSLELPEPAMEERSQISGRTDDRAMHRSAGLASPIASAGEQALPSPATQLARQDNAGKTTNSADTLGPLPSSQISSTVNSPQRYRGFPNLRRTKTTPGVGDRPILRRVLSMSTPSSHNSRNIATRDVELEAYNEIDFRIAEFFVFLDKELQKIELFYKEKEDSATDRLDVLREQLHFLRDRRLEEILASESKRSRPVSLQQNGRPQTSQPESDTDSKESDTVPSSNLRRPRSRPFNGTVGGARDTLSRMRTGHVGKTSKAMGQLGTPHLSAGGGRPRHQDYTRRDANKSVPYHTAKRKLKIAMAEYYRGLELLKSYALVNRTAFRKINKKFDKAAGISSNNRGKDYMKDKLNTAHFVQSDILDNLLQSVEDLYARYFERGNRKVAIGKLRQKIAKEGAFYGPTMRTGLLLGTGTVFTIQALVYAAIRLQHPQRPGEKTETSYLLQIYAGYFLMWLLVMLFCADAAVFSQYRVNYQFIFEFDTRHVLNWKQLCELPAWFGLLFGVIAWVNFSSWSPEAMYIYWPVILIGLSLILLCIPPPGFYWRSRSWMLVSNFRLLLAGIYPVEFRDFFLGDMYCSQTYALGNIEMFFCLYARHWNEPPMCNSSHSMLFGFFQTLPGIWRLLQCFRRYYDSRLWTHLANGAKYTCTILQYMSLSLWRIHKGHGLMAFFIVCSTVNGLYSSFWDLNYDWSMPLNVYGQPWPLLREILAYRKHIWWYYAAMVIDPILRFNWILYVIFANDVQHSTLVSFMVSFTEVLRRGLWVLFRVENEHCTNVERFRALRDPALPYEIKHEESETDEGEYERFDAADAAVHGRKPSADALPSGRDTESGPPSSTLGRASLRRRGTQHQQLGEEAAATGESPVYSMLRRAGSTFMAAHAQDYERKRRPENEEVSKEDDDADSDDSE